MEWNVKGLDRTSGEEREIRVFAEDAGAATARAAALGVVSYAVSPAATAMPPPIAAPLASCGNCGATIGRLETKYDYNGVTVCTSCSRKLTTERPVADDVVDAVAATVEYESPMDTWARMNPDRHRRRSCPICGSTAKPIRKSKGSRLVAILLLLLWILPGILYIVFYSGYVMVCPACGAKLADVS